MKRLIQAMLICVATLFSVGAAGAQSFEEVLETALTNSPDVQAQRQVVLTLEEAVELAKAGMRPTVSATGSIGYTKTDSAATGDADTIPTSVGLTASQPVFDGFQTENAVAAAEANLEAGRFQLAAVEQQVLLQAIEAYISVLQAEENLSLARSNVAVISKQLEATRARLEVGEVTRTDVAQARARLANSRANLRTREGELRTAREEFERVVGVPPQKLQALPPLPSGLPDSLKDAEEVALQRNPTYLATVLAVDAAKFNTEAAEGALLPQVTLDGATSVSSTQLFEGGSEGGTVTGSATVNVTVPLYTAGTLRSTVRSNVAVEGQRVAERDRARRQLLRDVGVNWENLITAKATIAANAEQVEAQRIAFRGVQQEAQVGSRTTLDVLDAEQDLLDARVALVNSRSDLQLAAYRLLAEMGILTSETLGIEAARYVPENTGAPVEAEASDDDWLKNFGD